MSKLGGAIVAGVAGLGLVGAGVVKGIAGEDHTTRDDAGEVVEGGEIGAFRIRLGDCIADMASGTFESVDAVPCSQPHEAEVFAAFNLPGEGDAAWPGMTSVNADADDGCYDRFPAFVGISYERSMYGAVSITPTEDSWEQLDDREVLCLITTMDGSTLTGSAEGSNR